MAKARVPRLALGWERGSEAAGQQQLQMANQHQQQHRLQGRREIQADPKLSSSLRPCATTAKSEWSEWSGWVKARMCLLDKAVQDSIVYGEVMALPGQARL